MPEANDKKYWKSLQERAGDPEAVRGAESEFPEELPLPATQPTRRGLAQSVTRILGASQSETEDPARRTGHSELGTRDSALARRDFLKLTGFTVAVATATGCSRAPVQKAIPLLVQPEQLVPGRPAYYATTCAGCTAGCGVLAKVRDGRPIKLEGNPQNAVSEAGLCAIGQASLLGLYDSQRLKHPLKSRSETTWDVVDREIADKLAAIRARGGAVRFLTGTITSPTTRASIGEFLAPFAEAKHIEYDPISRSAILDAHQRTHGVRALPSYHFDKAEAIVSFDADFLGTWISPAQFTAGWRRGRDLESRRFSYHLQLEPRMSVTGSKADRRLAVSPSGMPAVLSALAARLATKAGVAPGTGTDALSLAPEPLRPLLDDVADRLWKARGESLVISGSNDIREQVLVNFVNHVLGNYGGTLDLERPSYQARGNDGGLLELLGELNAGKVQALFVYGVNPAYDLPGNVTGALKKVPLLVSFAERQDETATLAHYICPDRHFLESWSDAESLAGAISVTQPVIRALAKTRPVVESLASWSGRPKPVYDTMRDFWRKRVYPRRMQEATFDEFWDTAVHDGYVEVKPETLRPKPFSFAAVQPLWPAKPADGFELVLYPTVAMYDGRHAYNPWLHELPDPITKVTWDNYASLSPAAAQRLAVKEGDVVRIEMAGAPALELPAYIQPGQHDNVVAVALGYGSRLSALFAGIGPEWMDATPSVGDNGMVGSNAAPLLAFSGSQLRYSAAGMKVARTGRHEELALTQHHHMLTVPKKLAPADGGERPIVQDTTLAAFFHDPHSGVEDHEEKEDLWPDDHPYNNLHWGMVFDLAACTGCSACVIACQAENNIAVVGKDEVRRNREMHWMRIDRYYTEFPTGEVAVAHQPLMCQQCGNAPCETVCPVLATVHSDDGLNSQVYNRCVGTRYCANNCPYKGRRFNWFNYRRDDTLQNLALNPDVAVRSRGVMEKCTFCVQRLQEAKIEAKRRGVRVEDGAAQTACQQSCPAKAIYFGDLNDSNSEVSRMMSNPRRYRLLSELNVRPSVGYLTVVRNRPEDGEKKNG